MSADSPLPNISPAKRALHGFVLTHPGLTTTALAEAFGLPEPVCAALCAELAEANWLTQDNGSHWRADTRTATDPPTAAEAKTAPFSMLFEQSLDGLFSGQRDVTERKTAFRRLTQSEARLRDLIASTADFIWEVDLEGRFTYLSGQVEQRLGYRPEELLGQSPFFMMDPEVAERMTAVFEQARDQGAAFGEQENYLTGKDGQRRYFAFNGVPMRDDSGTLIGYRGLNRDITDKKQADEALRSSEALLRTLFELSPESIVLVDPETTLPLQFNRVAHERLGYSADEFLQLRVSDYEVREDFEAVKAHIERIRRYGRDDFETLHRCRDGRLLNIVVSVQTTVWEGREVLYAMYRDVTELRTLSERLLLATDVGGIGIWEWSIDTNSLSSNEQMDRLYGVQLNSDQAAYSRWLQTLHPADRPRIERKVAEALNANIEFDAEFRIRRGDETRWLRAVARSVRDRSGQATKMIGVNWDITDSRRAQERLARSEAQFRGAFEIAPNGMALVDSEGRWLQVNQALCDILGYTAAELLALDFQSISDPRGLDEDLSYLQALLSGQTDEVRFEKHYIHKEGHRIPALLSASAVRDDQGQLSFVVAHILDLTERRASEAALLAAKEAAEAANRAKGEFLANMSHEIRTPLNAMIGLTDLTLGTRLDARQRDYLEKVRQSSGALLDILNDILDYSKIEAGQVKLAHRRFQLRDLLDQLTALFQATVEAKGLDLLYRVAPEVPRQLIGDPMRLGQVLNNLVGNAVKFTEQGRVELDVSVVEEQDAAVTLCFCIQDTGIGIAAGTLEHLFQAFTQADGSITRRFGGTGLGLSISQRLVSLMGGRITANSIEGEGSRFQFAVPFPLPETDSQRFGVRPPDLAHSRILLVGKDPLTLDIVDEILQSWRLPLIRAADCAEARQQIADAAAAGTPIDLMLLNAKPCLDCRTCPFAAAPMSTSGLPSRHFGEPATPLILMVTYLEQSRLLERGSASELPRFLTKPVTTSALFDAIASVTHSAPRQTPDTKAERPLETNALQGRCILVAEDNPVNQIVAEEMLKRFGARVLMANNGREAVELALQHSIDAVLMDLQMPEMDGFEATTSIRAEKPMLPIIALTAAALERDRERCLSAGMNDHLGKPVSSAQLLATLSHWVQAEAVTDPVPAAGFVTANDAPSIDPLDPLDPQAFSKLRRLITASDYVSPEILADLRHQASPATQLVLSQVEQALARFDYDAASRALDKLPSLPSSTPAS